MRFFSKACEYGIRCVLYVSTVEGEGQFVPVRSVAEHLNIPHHFLAKIVQTLTQGGVLDSYRGPNGGVALARSSDKITLMDVVTALDGSELFSECLLGLPGCGEKKPCPLHGWWKGVRNELTTTFLNTAIAQLSHDVANKRFRLMG